MGSSDGTSDRSLLLFGRVLQALAAEKGGTTLRDLQDDGRVDVARSLETCVDDGGRGDVLIISYGYSEGAGEVMGDT